MEQLKVTLLQAYLFWENSAKNLQNISLKLSDIRERTDLIVLPEMFNTGFTMNAVDNAEKMDGKTVNWMRDTARKFNAVVTGSLIIEENGNFYNRMVWMRPDASYETYDKKHLFGLGEEDKTYTAGNKQVVVELKGWKIRLAICYDLRFPVWLRNHQQQYDLLLVVANWPEKRAHHWRMLIPARAVENQSFIIALNRVGYDGKQIYYSGDTTCLSPAGDVIYYKRDEEDLYTFTINKAEVERVRTEMPFLKDADDFNLI
ncbi:nitrilase family protein [Pedobacter puniceum]|jgi:predicted amidohydrolase|uniref:Omega-amidase YafV n=1 Tax=Pedobacter puniceum TaxID=2666136 RepID=A0A7K0FK27_9SPHI|nr:nitrilase family protein [Pedobacter puniceum]MRX46316.1 nitrilase family protein [Pedobacter puniceum]